MSDELKELDRKSAVIRVGAVARRSMRLLPWARMAQATITIWLFVFVVLVQARPKTWVAVLANPSLFLISLWMSTLAHEASHAFAARALGMRVWRVVIGVGPSLFTLRARGIEWRVGSVPLGGLTFIVPVSEHWIRVRFWLAIAAGPFVNAALLLAASLLVRAHVTTEIAPARMIQISNAVLLIGSLIPLPIGQMSGGTDGWKLATIWRMPKSFPRDLKAMPHMIKFVEAMRAERRSEAAAALQAAIAESPENLSLQHAKALFELREGRVENAREMLQKVLDSPDLDARMRIMVENNLAWTAVFLDDGRWLEEADELSRRVVQKSPKLPNAHGTRGAILVLRSKPRQALRYLHRAYAAHIDDASHAHVAAWLAAAEAALGRSDEAQKWLDLAEEFDPNCQSLPRVRGLLTRA